MSKYLTIRSIHRGIKLKLIEGYEWTPKLNLIDQGKLHFIKNNFIDEVVSGSFALSMFFDLKRKPDDIDIISLNPNKYGELEAYQYPHDCDYVGSKKFKIGGFFSKYQKVDFFNYKTNFLEWNGIKIQDPFDIIKKKSNIILESDSLIIKEKHSIDLMIVAESIINDRSTDRIESHKVPSFCLEY